jgi:hypothetical protein
MFGVEILDPVSDIFNLRHEGARIAGRKFSHVCWPWYKLHFKANLVTLAIILTVQELLEIFKLGSWITLDPYGRSLRKVIAHLPEWVSRYPEKLKAIR